MSTGLIGGETRLAVLERGRAAIANFADWMEATCEDTTEDVERAMLASGCHVPHWERLIRDLELLIADRGIGRSFRRQLRANLAEARKVQAAIERGAEAERRQ